MVLVRSFAPGHEKQSHLMSKICGFSLTKFKKYFPSVYGIHYMDDILMPHKDRAFLPKKNLTKSIKILASHSLIKAPEKKSSTVPI